MNRSRNRSVLRCRHQWHQRSLIALAWSTTAVYDTPLGSLWLTVIAGLVGGGAGLLALVGPGFPDRLRAYLLTVAVVDDIVALLVIAIAYSGHVSTTALLIGIGLFSCILLIRAAGIQPP